MLAVISFAILFSYTAYYLSRVGLLPSHSDSYFALGKQGWMFQVSLFLTAFLLMIPLLDVTPEPFKFTAFFTCAPVLFTALAPDFRKENGKVTMERKVHMLGAKIGGFYRLSGRYGWRIRSRGGYWWQLGLWAFYSICLIKSSTDLFCFWSIGCLATLMLYY